MHGRVDLGPLLAPSPFHVIVTDVQMPKLEGYAATKLLRTKGCTLPILMLSAHAMTEDRERCLAAGCTGYLAKPIDSVELIEACRQALTGELVANVGAAAR
jgi:CheY-like chemotaxis protein